MTGKKNDKNVSDLLMASTHLRERRESRHAAAIPIAVSGIDRHGTVFHERTVTTNVSAWGCGFRVSVELWVDDIIALQASPAENAEPTPARQSLFQVVRVARENDGWNVGAWRIDQESFWEAALQEIVKCAEIEEDSGAGTIAERIEKIRSDARK